ncbi:MAG: outer membrane beta-barrel protein [Ekhidna sp.]
MGQGSFEDIIGKKFEGKGQEVPSGVWENVNNALNADLVSHYQSSHSRYRWLTAAAILIAISSFAIHYVTIPIQKKAETNSYNALLTKNFNSVQFQVSDLSAGHLTFSWLPAIILDKPENEPPVNIDNVDRSEELATIEIQTKTAEIELAEASNEIKSFYRTLGQSSRKKSSEKNEFWAGLEAGAGKFNPNFSGANSISNSINSSAAATAVGAGDFSNPSANAVQDGMNEGVATSVGFDFGVKIGRKWTLESGLAYTNLNNTGSASVNVLNGFSNNGEVRTGAIKPENPNQEELETSARIQTSANGEIDLNSNIQFASMPLKAGYYIMDNKFSVRLNAGVAANYLIENSLSDPSNQIISGAHSDLYNDWSFDGIGGLEFGYRLFNKIDMTIEPNYRYSITPLSNSITSPSRFVVQTGFRYTLR